MTKHLAYSIVKTLFNAGYIAYFAGGWVRDHLLGISSEEIDIATNASPERIAQLFSKTILVGARFGVVIVVLKGQNFEVTTFRKDHPYLDGRHPEGVDYSNPQQDAIRRDFTINGMFFDPLTEIIYDYVEGQADLHRKILRAIGDPETRFKEDKLRLLRAIRFSFRLDFAIEENTQTAIKKLSHTLLPSVSMERIWQEFVKMSQYPRFGQALVAMHDYGLLQTIFPILANVSTDEVKKRVSGFSYFPINTPTIVYLWELFPKASMEERIALCHYLKITKEDVKLAKYFAASKSLFNQAHITRAEWAHFYAHPHSSLFLEIEGSKTGDRTTFFSFHDKQREVLKFHIEHIQKKDPLLKAFHLQEAGIQPGIQMGLLLKEGEILSINEDIRDIQEVIKRLKVSSFWQKK